MKVLFVASVYHHFTSFHIPFMQHLQEKGYEVWAAAESDDPVKSELTRLGVRCIDIPFHRSPFGKGNIEAYRMLKKIFSTDDFKMVHVHTPVASFLSRLAFRHATVGEIVYTVHGFHFFTGAPTLNWIIYFQLERIAARWTDRLITINGEDYERALKMGYPQGRVHYVRGVGVDSSGFQLSDLDKRGLKEELGVADDAIIISYIAEINKNKNHQFLLRNWKKIKMKNPKATLLLIGDGYLLPEIKRMVISEKLLDIFIVGYRKDIEKLLAITDIVCLLSHREGLPKSIMEAKVARLPCIVSDTRGLRDLITDGEDGYIVPLRKDERLVEAFCTLLQNRKLRRRMGSIAYRNIEPFLLENVLPDYVSIYDEILSEG